MLYRTPRFSIAARIRGAFARIFGVLAELRRSSADTAHLDGLNEHHLRDLGVQRIEERGEIFYR